MRRPACVTVSVPRTIGAASQTTLPCHFDFLVVPLDRWLSALPAAVFDALPVAPLRSTLLAAFAARGLVRLPVTRITSFLRLTRLLR